MFTIALFRIGLKKWKQTECPKNRFLSDILYDTFTHWKRSLPLIMIPKYVFRNMKNYCYVWPVFEAPPLMTAGKRVYWNACFKKPQWSRQDGTAQPRSGLLTTILPPSICSAAPRNGRLTFPSCWHRWAGCNCHCSRSAPYLPKPLPALTAARQSHSYSQKN